MDYAQSKAVFKAARQRAGLHAPPERQASVQRLTVEIHEAAVTNIDALIEFRAFLRDLRMQLAFDDFGSGQARLIELTDMYQPVIGGQDNLQTMALLEAGYRSLDQHRPVAINEITGEPS